LDIQVIDVDVSDALSVSLLEGFYNRTYLEEFTDPNEQESFGNMLDALKNENPANTYKIIMMVNEKEIIGIIIANYIHLIKVMFIEFLIVESSYRDNGYGRKLIQIAKSHFSDLELIVAEVNDPRYTYDDSFCPLDRVRVWQKFGFRKLDFNYEQPALSDDKDPVKSLMLMCDSPSLSLTSNLVLEIIRSYIEYAMRIVDVGSNESFIRMRTSLRGIDEVKLVKS
jgi:ribosomal protein S18 acetylase RimI-like enzyme